MDLFDFESLKIFYRGLGWEEAYWDRLFEGDQGVWNWMLGIFGVLDKGEEGKGYWCLGNFLNGNLRCLEGGF